MKKAWKGADFFPLSQQIVSCAITSLKSQAE